MHHPSYDDYWQARDISRHTKKMPAMLEVGGYYDAEDLAGPWRTFRGIEKLSPGADNHIAIGPWSHGGWSRGDGNAHGTLRWATSTGPWFRDSVELPFFMHYLANGLLRRCRRCLCIAPAERNGIATTHGRRRTPMRDLYTCSPAAS
jgi:predicted acyl esterase